MLASPISNSLSENAPAPANATVLPFDPQPSSMFTNVFLALLKGSGNSSKSGVAGKPQDSGREPAPNSGAVNNSSGLFPQSLVAPALAAILPDSPAPAMVDSFAVAQMFSMPLNSSLAVPDVSETAAEDGNAEGQLTTAGEPLTSSSNPGLSEEGKNGGIRSTSIYGASAGPTLRRNDEGWGTQLFNPAPETARMAATVPSIVPAGSAVNSFSSGAFLADPNAGTNSSVAGFESLTDLNPLAGYLGKAASFPGSSFESAPGGLALSGLNTAANPVDVVTSAAAKPVITTGPIAPAGNPIPGPQELGFSPNRGEAGANFSKPAATLQNVSGDPATVIQSSLPSGSSLTGNNAAQAASASFSFQNLQALIPSGWAQRISGNFQSQTSANRTEPPASQSIMDLAPSLMEAFARSSAKPEAAVAPADKFQMQFQAQLANSAPAAPATAISAIPVTPTDLNPGGATSMPANPPSGAAFNRGNENPLIQYAARDLNSSIPLSLVSQQASGRDSASAPGSDNNFPGLAPQGIAPNVTSPEAVAPAPLKFSMAAPNPNTTQRNAVAHGTSPGENPLSWEPSVEPTTSVGQAAASPRVIGPTKDQLPPAYMPYASVNSEQAGESAPGSAATTERASMQYLPGRLMNDGQTAVAATGSESESDPIALPLAVDSSSGHWQPLAAAPELTATIDSDSAGHVADPATKSGQSGTPALNNSESTATIQASLPARNPIPSAADLLAYSSQASSNSNPLPVLARPGTSADISARDVVQEFATNNLQPESPTQKFGPANVTIPIENLPSVTADANESSLTTAAPAKTRNYVYTDIGKGMERGNAQPAAPSSSASNSKIEIAWAEIADLPVGTAVAGASVQQPATAPPSLANDSWTGQARDVEQVSELRGSSVVDTIIPGSEFNSAPVLASPPSALESATPALQNSPVPVALQTKVSPPTAPASPMNFLNSSALQSPISAVPAQSSNSVSASSSAPQMQDEASSSTTATAPQSPENPAVPSPNSQPTSSAIPGTVNAKAAQTAHADLAFLNLLTPSLTTAAAAIAKVSMPVPVNPAANQTAQFNVQSPVGASQLLPETLEHSAAKSAAIGASTFKLTGNLQTQPANSTPPSSASALAEKSQTQAQENSNGSSSNDSNTKPDHASAVVGTHTDDKAFIQTLDTAAVNPAIVHSPAADAATAAAAAASAPPAPAQPANSAPQTPAQANSGSQHAESLPEASQNQAVVSAAHMIQQSGQTEIRIEMQADSLGGVELRAHIAGDQIGATIAVEHHDAQMALASDLPSLHSALSEKNLRVETLTVSQGTFSSLSGGAGQDAGQKGFPQSPAKFAYLEQPEEPQSPAESPTDWAGQANPRSGLSVVA